MAARESFYYLFLTFLGKLLSWRVQENQVKNSHPTALTMLNSEQAQSVFDAGGHVKFRPVILLQPSLRAPHI